MPVCDRSPICDRSRTAPVIREFTAGRAAREVSSIADRFNITRPPSGSFFPPDGSRSRRLGSDRSSRVYLILSHARDPPALIDFHSYAYSCSFTRDKILQDSGNALTDYYVNPLSTRGRREAAREKHDCNKENSGGTLYSRTPQRVRIALAGKHLSEDSFSSGYPYTFHQTPRFSRLYL